VYRKTLRTPSVPGLIAAAAFEIYSSVRMANSEPWI